MSKTLYLSNFSFTWNGADVTFALTWCSQILHKQNLNCRNGEFRLQDKCFEHSSIWYVDMRSRMRWWKFGWCGKTWKYKNTRCCLHLCLDMRMHFLMLVLTLKKISKVTIRAIVIKMRLSNFNVPTRQYYEHFEHN